MGNDPVFSTLYFGLGFVCVFAVDDILYAFMVTYLNCNSLNTENAASVYICYHTVVRKTNQFCVNETSGTMQACAGCDASETGQ